MRVDTRGYALHPPVLVHHITTLNEASTSLLLAFDPTAEEGVHPCVED